MTNSLTGYIGVSGDLAPLITLAQTYKYGNCVLTQEQVKMIMHHLDDDHYYCLQGRFDKELVVYCVCQF